MDLKKHFADLHLGKKRTAQEDSIGELLFNNSKYGNVYVLCDGMGGHEGGKMASDTAVKSIIEYFNNSPSESPTIALKEAIEFANIQIFGLAQSDSQFKGMGTTCCVLLEKNNLIYIAHVGDSRIYISSDDKFFRITKDHSFVQELFDNGQISDQEMETHPRKNELTQALGVSTEVNVEVCSDPILAKKGDNFLICSDGLCGLLDDKKIFDIVNKDNTNKEIGNNLIDAANNAGGSDNISVIYISVNESPHNTSQFVNRNNVNHENLTKTQLFDTGQKADILAKGNYLSNKKNKKSIFIFVGIILMSFLMFLIISNFLKNDVIKEEVETAAAVKQNLHDLDKNLYEGTTTINNEKVRIFYYFFKADPQWTINSKDFTPFVENVGKEGFVFDAKKQEFYWNGKFITKNEYDSDKISLYANEILPSSFIFIRKNNLKPKTRIITESNPYRDGTKEKAKEAAAKLAEKNKQIALKKRAEANIIKEKDANINKEREDINKANKNLKSFIDIIIDSKSKIEKLSINDQKVSDYLDEANKNYNKQTAEFFKNFEGFSDIPPVISTTNFPIGILELNSLIKYENGLLKNIAKKSSNDYSNSEKKQNIAAACLNKSKQNLKLAQDLKGKFKIIYNVTNVELKSQCSDDLSKIERASDNDKKIQSTSDGLILKFNSIKDDLEKINQLLKKSENLIELLSKNVEIYKACIKIKGTEKCGCDKGEGENGIMYKDCHKKHINK